MKTKAYLIGLSLLSGSVMADTYNTQVDLDYIDDDGFDIITLQGAYYFDNVSTSKTPWAEAAFVGRNSNISAHYFDFDGEADALGLGVELFGDKSNNLYGALSTTRVDAGDEDDTILAGELGYFFSDNWLVSVATTDVDDAPIYLKTKYIGNLGGGKYFNVEASIDDEEHDLTVMGDYYWTPQSSVGLALSNEDGYDYGVRFQHFFSPAISARFSYESFDSGDAIAIGLTARF